MNIKLDSVYMVCINDNKIVIYDLVHLVWCAISVSMMAKWVCCWVLCCGGARAGPEYV
jgi:hypothetical protein